MWFRVLLRRCVFLLTACHGGTHNYSGAREGERWGAVPTDLLAAHVLPECQAGVQDAITAGRVRGPGANSADGDDTWAVTTGYTAALP